MVEYAFVKYNQQDMNCLLIVDLTNITAIRI